VRSLKRAIHIKSHDELAPKKYSPEKQLREKTQPRPSLRRKRPAKNSVAPSIAQIVAQFTRVRPRWKLAKDAEECSASSAVVERKLPSIVDSPALRGKQGQDMRRIVIGMPAFPSQRVHPPDVGSTGI